MSFNSDVCRRRFTNDNIENREDFSEEKKLMKKFYVKWLKNFYEYKEYKIKSLDGVVNLLYRPTCSSNLGLVRALFGKIIGNNLIAFMIGLMMIIDIPDERGLGSIDLKYGDPMRCNFPLFDWLSPLSLEYMGLLYFIMWLGSFGICLGLRFQTSCLMFILPYWYIYLLDKTVWNNHSYLYGLVAILFSVTKANHSFSLDALINNDIKDKPVPLWNYAIIRFQFFLLYFYAGVKKFDPDWIGGYSMSSLSLHWVFNPFRLVLNNQQIDFWIIHIFGFVFDLTVGFLLLIDKTRPIAMVFSAAFHLMNSCMFHIGQFPYVCLVTTPIFCSYNLPEQLWKYLTGFSGKKSENLCKKYSKMHENKLKKVTWKQKMTCYLLAAYIGFQLFLPFSHFITQGYNNWTNGLYGYSWDMMVQNWDSNVVVIRVVDNQSKKEFFLDPEAWVGNTRYSKHGDMLVQYAKCLKKNLNSFEISNMQKKKDIRIGSSFSDISIYVDVWCSLNGRFQQRMFDPRQNLLTAEWNPFIKISWLMPLLSELSSWRKNLENLEKEVFKWSNYSDVLFFADFPGLHLENYITSDFTNVSLTVLQGVVILEQFDGAQDSGTFNITLYKGDSSKIKEGIFHKVYTISKEPSCYMYTYNNHSMEKLGHDPVATGFRTIMKGNYIQENLNIRIEKFWNSLFMLRACFNKLIFNTPFPPQKIKMY